jgi:hypothetical protein
MADKAKEAEKVEEVEEPRPGNDEVMKKCFIIMPIADFEPYTPGHFRRVYDHIIKPACLHAGFQPVRADDPAEAHLIVINILRSLLSADMAICDLSGRNPNVFYELGIRHAFNKPVALIKDEKTSRVFDVQDLKDIQYQSTLRIDQVESAVSTLSSSLKATYEMSQKSDGEQVNSILELLSIKPAHLPNSVEISNDTALLLEAIQEIRQRITEVEISSHRAGENEMFPRIFAPRDNLAIQKEYAGMVLSFARESFKPKDKVIDTKRPNLGEGRIIRVNNDQIIVEIGGRRSAYSFFHALESLEVTERQSATTEGSKPEDSSFVL